MFTICIVLLTLISSAQCRGNISAGTTLFWKKNVATKCWSPDELAQLKARQIFNDLVPLPAGPEEVNNTYVRNMLKFFKQAVSKVETSLEQEHVSLIKDALVDTFGAYLRSEVLPSVRFAYYAGFVNYRNARSIHDYYSDIKKYLNTEGIGWRKPTTITQWSKITVTKIPIGIQTLFHSCNDLVLKYDEKDCLYLPIPKTDDASNPSAIALPFKSDSLVSLTSPSSDKILLKFYTTASRCILRKSPEPCRHSDFVNFNDDMWYWLKRDVSDHLADETLYAAYGGVFRIAAAVQAYGRGLSHRSVHQENVPNRSRFINAQYLPFTGEYYSYYSCSSKWYIVIVLLIAGIIAMVHLFYNYILGDNNACKCTKRSCPPLSSRTNCACPVTVLHKGHKQQQKEKQPYTFRGKSLSLGSVQTQKVYDLNDNEEKEMEIILSGGTESLSDDTRPREKVIKDKHRSQSPPKIETPISQLRVSKTRYLTSPSINQSMSSKLPIYSTSEYSRAYHRQQTWSYESGSSSSASSESDSKSRGSRRFRSPRDLAWAHRVVSKQRRNDSITTSGTGTCSYITLLTKR